ncbi:hypothetical protein COU78_02565 [Candidatus Peregrinibacteria bacterium CG10_big_fil_rev_8_21_14_0_10_49_24]|nr:MAG: hypothetical protein COV83_02545 [Candidatus Peregrinibacteria bacterium CG11_big_fil_rev_8_21_14_0_20_49_14]PIR51020.1 MAG: hypothetical protein COU78_02565 [Candidatus Peregrinibacteria bacterium CG10_big_fil_rev_8_21_14_0_10_49_24]PJA67573.1 MAG: hypothetical protein CO157_04045 [Candidatus Peregrinibacteria bacterium CG_4_9_14_3_um_filter_49_12]
MAFLVGNMMGQSGWHLFWASVLGSEDDSFIAYTGTVTPLEKVPDYTAWSRYGGGSELHTYRQIPQDVLIELPFYDESSQIRTRNASSSAVFYSVGHAGSYTTGAQDSGSHPGVDIRVPIGTPVRAVANGIVSEVKVDSGYGNVVVIRHPNMPDPDRPNRTVTLYSAYAHLQSSIVTVGAVVSKGEHIAYSGDTGFASGPHLHFQMDKESAPFHPYWPFTTAEANLHGLNITQAVDSGLHAERLKQFTVNPMPYVQANFRPVEALAQAVARSTPPQKEAPPPRVIDKPEEVPPVLEPQASPQQPVQSVVTAAQPRLSRVQRAAKNREERIQDRITRLRFASRQVERSGAPTVVQRTEVVSTDSQNVTGPESVRGVNIQHDGTYSGRGWERVVIQLTDENGNLIVNPLLENDLHLRTAYGDAEFRPSILTQLDFTNGEAQVFILPLGRRTVIMQAQPFLNLSKPMQYTRAR